MAKPYIVRALFALTAVSIATGGCIYVDLTPEAEQVEVRAPEAVADCERIGRTKTRTQTKAWIFPRIEENVLEELRLMARDDAAEMGGTAVAPLGEADDGRQEWAIYRCPGASAEGGAGE